MTMYNRTSVIKFTSDKLIEIYPGFTWYFNDVKFSCVKIERFLHKSYFVIHIYDDNGIHVFRRDTNRIRVGSLYNEYKKIYG